MIETRYLKDNIENIQKLLAVPCLKSFQTGSVGKLLKLSKIREYPNVAKIFRSNGALTLYPCEIDAFLQLYPGLNPR
jgi:hypothetical protein